MKFCWSTITVKDMDESLQFYQEIIGLPMNRRFKGPEVEIAFLGEGETKIELICAGKGKECNMGKDISLGFEIKSVDEMIAFLQTKDISVYSGPFQPNPHMKFFSIQDPNGLMIQLVENIKPVSETKKKK